MRACRKIEVLFRQSLIFAAIFFISGLIMTRGELRKTVPATIVATVVYAGFMAVITAFARRRGGGA